MKFYKYQGTGNDFIMVDNRNGVFPNLKDETIIKKICDRRFGIGADGLILIQNHADYDFEMIYFNADGSQSMCGNGSRCAVLFANFLNIINTETNFLTIDGPHYAFIKDGLIHLKMNDVNEVKHLNGAMFIDTGSPHYVKYVEDIENYDVYNEGKKIRYGEPYGESGTNVNFVEFLGSNEFFVRTYERGVEDETLSCGTGVTAASLSASFKNFDSPVKIKTLGGELQVSFKRLTDQKFGDIYLIGPAGMVFEGKIAVEEL